MIPFIDMHCDTISVMLNNARMGNDIELRKNNLQVDLERLISGGCMCQNFALFTDQVLCKELNLTPLEYALNLSDTFDREIEKNSDIIRPAYSGTDIEKNFADGYISALKTIEEGAVYEGKASNLKKFYDMGVRKSTITWNYENELAYPNLSVTDKKTGEYHCVGVDTENGLKPAGFEMIKAMEELGIIIDVSHLNDAGIYDILKTVKPSTPIIASHSNCRALRFHPRNLTDDMLRKIAEHGGVAGITFCDAFLSDDQKETRLSRISDIVSHISYMKQIGGIDMIGIGTDFDGTLSVQEVNGSGEMQKLADAMSIAGFTTDEIEKVFYKNVLRVYKEVLG